MITLVIFIILCKGIDHVNVTKASPRSTQVVVVPCGQSDARGTMFMAPDLKYLKWWSHEYMISAYVDHCPCMLSFAFIFTSSNRKVLGFPYSFWKTNVGLRLIVLYATAQSSARAHPSKAIHAVATFRSGHVAQN